MSRAYLPRPGIVRVAVRGSAKGILEIQTGILVQRKSLNEALRRLVPRYYCVQADRDSKFGVV
jgi:hypothetical protein